jgi:hypothetical protein
MRLTPEEEAAYALDHRLTRADLKPHVQALYDRMLQERKAESCHARRRRRGPGYVARLAAAAPVANGVVGLAV